MSNFVGGDADHVVGDDGPHQAQAGEWQTSAGK